MPAIDPDAALRSPTATAIASASSSSSGGICAPAREPVAARDARLGLDRVAEVAQLLDVAADRPRPHLEPGGQLRDPTTRSALLQQRE